MNTPETINIEKYIDALDNLLGSDNAYYAGDPDVDAIVEVIVVVKKLEERVKELNEENEKLKAEIKDLEEEYDRIYEQAEADILGNMADGGTSCHWCIEKHRINAVKEFAGKAKELYTDESITDDMQVSIRVIKQNIDDLVKEMTGF